MRYDQHLLTGAYCCVIGIFYNNPFNGLSVCIPGKSRIVIVDTHFSLAADNKRTALELPGQIIADFAACARLSRERRRGGPRGTDGEARKAGRAGRNEAHHQLQRGRGQRTGEHPEVRNLNQDQPGRFPREAAF